MSEAPKELLRSFEEATRGALVRPEPGSPTLVADGLAPEELAPEPLPDEPLGERASACDFAAALGAELERELPFESERWLPDQDELEEPESFDEERPREPELELDEPDEPPQWELPEPLEEPPQEPCLWP